MDPATDGMRRSFILPFQVRQLKLRCANTTLTLEWKHAVSCFKSRRDIWLSQYDIFEANGGVSLLDLVLD
jgi:hypothetical protein